MLDFYSLFICFVLYMLHKPEQVAVQINASHM